MTFRTLRKRPCQSSHNDLRHAQETWLIEDDVPRVLRLEWLGHKRGSTDDRYSHVTEAVIGRMLEQLQRRGEIDGGRTWGVEGSDEAW
jgi:hypothetical protein